MAKPKGNRLNNLHKEKWRAEPPALAKNSCGCFLPDLTRFTTLQCGEARQVRILPQENTQRQLDLENHKEYKLSRSIQYRQLWASKIY